MNRREMFKTLLGVGAASQMTTPVSAGTTPIPRAFWNDRFIPSADYMLHWTGWKAHLESTMLCGQWLAYPSAAFGRPYSSDRQPYLYLAVPGMIGGPYVPGQVFNIDPRRRPVTTETPELERERLIVEGFGYMETLVEVFGRWQSHAAHEHRCPLYQFPIFSKDGLLAESVNP